MKALAVKVKKHTVMGSAARSHGNGGGQSSSGGGKCSKGSNPGR